MGMTMCAFLNSSAGGVFDIGVTQKTGLVLGFVCTPEQQVRLSRVLDEVAEMEIHPPVMTTQYFLRFVNVVKKRGPDLAIPDHFRVMEVMKEKHH
jgi:hypothetical protein